MKTEFIPHAQLTDKTIECAGAVLKNGGLVVFQTETVYGLGANALDAKAAGKIYAAKGRPSDNPLIVHIAEPKDAEKYAFVCEEYHKLAKAFMPGPLTVILPKKDCIPDTVSGGLDSVGIRCQGNEIARRLIRAAGVPVAAPSANLSGKPSPTTAAHALSDLDGKVDMILDGGACRVGLESTIIKLEDGKATLLRPGGVTPDMLRPLLPSLTLADAVTNQLSPNARPLSPGMKYKHYAPASPLTLVGGPDTQRQAYFAASASDTLLLVFDEEAGLFAGRKVIPIGGKNDPKAQAARLFSALREADRQGCAAILAPLPEKEGLSLALYNRMIRAAAHRIVML